MLFATPPLKFHAGVTIRPLAFLAPASTIRTHRFVALRARNYALEMRSAVVLLAVRAFVRGTEKHFVATPGATHHAVRRAACTPALHVHVGRAAAHTNTKTRTAFFVRALYRIGGVKFLRAPRTLKRCTVVTITLPGNLLPVFRAKHRLTRFKIRTPDSL